MNKANNQDVEAGLINKRTDIFKQTKRPPALVSTLTKRCSKSVPTYLWPKMFTPYLIDLDSRNQEGETPLIIAATQLQTDVVEELILNGVDVNLQNDKGYTALHRAVAACSIRTKQKSIQIVEQLLKEGATTTSFNSNGYTPLHTAVKIDSLETVKMLAESDDEVLTEKSKDEKEETAFEMAVRLERNTIVEF